MVTRDYITLKVWDLRNPGKPFKTMKVCDFIEPKLCDLYENEGIYDKFELEVSPCSKYIMTGSYGDKFHLIDRN